MSAAGDFRDIEREALLRRSQRSAARTAGKNPPAGRASQPATGAAPVVRLGRSAAITFNPALLTDAERSRFSRHMNARVSPGKGVLSNAEYYAQQAFVDVAQVSVPTVSGRDNVHWVLKRGDGSSEVVPDFVARAVQPRETGYPGSGMTSAAAGAATTATGPIAVVRVATQAAAPIAATFAAPPVAVPVVDSPAAESLTRPIASAATAALAAAAQAAVAQAEAAQAAAAQAEAAQAEATQTAAAQTAAAHAAAQTAIAQAAAAQAAAAQAEAAQTAAARAEAAQAAAAHAAAQAATAQAAAAQAMRVPQHVPLAGPPRLPAPQEPDASVTVRSAADAAAHLAAQRAPQAPLTRSTRAPVGPSAPSGPIVPSYVGTVTGSQILRAERDRAREILARATELRVQTGHKSTGPNYRAALISENRARTKFFELNAQTEQATAREARVEYAALRSSLTEGTESYRLEYEAQLTALLSGVALPSLADRISAAEAAVRHQEEIAALATDSAERWAAGSPQRKVNHTE